MRSVSKIMTAVALLMLVMALCPVVALADEGSAADDVQFEAATTTADSQGDTISGTWGTCPWEIVDGVLTVYPGSVSEGVLDQGPWFDYRTIVTSARFVTDDNGNKVVASGNSLNSLFRAFSDLTSVDLSGLDTSGATDMQYMFFGCMSLTSLSVAYFDTSNVTNMCCMFNNCTGLESINGLVMFNTQNVTRMEYMFFSCQSLTSLDLSSFDTSNVTSSDHMMGFCTSLTCVKLGEGTKVLSALPEYNINGHTDWYSTVDKTWYTASDIAGRLGIADTYTKEAPIDISNAQVTIEVDSSVYTGKPIGWRLTVVVDGKELRPFQDYGFPDSAFLYAMTYEIPIIGINEYTGQTSATVTIEPATLTATYAGETIVPGASPKLEVVVDGFVNGETPEALGANYVAPTIAAPSQLEPGESYELTPAGGSAKNYAFEYVAGTLTVQSEVGPEPGLLASGTWGTCPWEIDAEGALTVYPGEAGDSGADASPWAEYAESITSATFASDGDAKVVATGNSLVYLFAGCNKLDSIDFTGFDTSKATSMAFMFSDCTSLKSVDLSNFDTSSVTKMNALFYHCYSLETIEGLENFNTQNVENMQSMFNGCQGLTSLDLTSFDTSSVTDVRAMFASCYSLETIEGLDNFNMKNVDDMGSMFFDCRALTSLDLSNFDTSSVTDMGAMFYGCSSLTEVNLSGFNTQRTFYMNSMFYGCSSLTKLDLSSFETPYLINTYYMFNGCSSLTELDLSKFDTSRRPSDDDMFAYCQKLSKVTLGEKAQVTLPSYSVNGHEDWYSTNDGKWYTAEQVAGRTVADTYTKGAVVPDVPWPMYRLYNPYDGGHMFTSDIIERNALVSYGWLDEGTAFNILLFGDTPLYRLYNQWNGEHFFTTDAAEKDNLVGLGWTDEGVVGYVEPYTAGSTAPAGMVPVYRVFNKWLTANTHLFTVDEAEYANVVNLGWNDEGIAFYGYAATVSGEASR